MMADPPDGGHTDEALRRARAADQPNPSVPETDLARFFSKVDKDGPIPKHRIELGPCWLWKACKDSSGYGSFRYQGRTTSAHRFSYVVLAGGTIPDGLQLDHLCRTRHCVRPDHLEPVTPQENILRSEAPSAANARKTHCARGHEFNEQNTYTTWCGGRGCRVCNREWGNASYAAHRDEINAKRRAAYAAEQARKAGGR
ncbi:HNH endonuclease [Streptomyces caniscabiei]|uniref:HNH endonuclease n=1 Tax=Streptomyces caniscabiei TaxID=2746961 RepID=UPI0018C8AD20|nr:HNH endonuclease [Streptomyces caniscabiei]